MSPADAVTLHLTSMTSGYLSPSSDRIRQVRMNTFNAQPVRVPWILDRHLSQKLPFKKKSNRSQSMCGGPVLYISIPKGWGTSQVHYPGNWTTRLAVGTEKRIRSFQSVQSSGETWMHPSRRVSWFCVEPWCSSGCNVCSVETCLTGRSQWKHIRSTAWGSKHTPAASNLKHRTDPMSSDVLGSDGYH